MIKVAAPNMACKIIDWAIQAHGGGVTTDFGLASPARTRERFGLQPFAWTALASESGLRG